MGTILQERAPQQRPEREWRRRASLGGGGGGVRPNAASSRMGKRPSQRKCLQPQQQENHHEKQRPQQRRKHKASSAKRTAGRHSAQGSPESKLEDRMEPKVQVADEKCGHREQTPTGPSLSGRTSASPCPGLRPLEGETDSDTDLSEAERLPALTSVKAPPQLELRPEVIDAPVAQRHRARGQSCDGYDFPDFLPPPFNSWNLRQLAMFYNTEGRRAPRPRPVGSLERYLERLLQLEWHQVQSVQAESGESSASDVTYSCHRSAAAAASSRLSSPKCILQCQRAFPLTFLSSLVSHSALLSSCACTLCCIRYFTCSTSCCHTAHSHTRLSRISPVLERREPVSLPRRSCSESRDTRSSARQGHVTHLRRMQASGNIRNPAHGADVNPGSSARETAGTQGHAAGVRKRSGSEQRRRGAERQHNGAEKPRSGSECRPRRGTERRKTTEEIKPDAVAAIMDNLPASKYSAVNRPNRQKQVEFVT